MIREVESLDACGSFIDEMRTSPPLAAREVCATLQRAAERPDEHLFGVFDGEEPIGLFAFLILEGERYAEMLVGFARSLSAYRQLADFLRERYPGFQFDFVYNPVDRALGEMLRARGATFYEEQQKMVFSGTLPSVDTDGIEPLSDRYLPQYLALHDTDCYWTGEKVAAAPDRFNVFLAVDGGTVVGYIDVTNRFEENEPVMLEVSEPHRRRGWGRKLLAKALEANAPRGMRLQVDVGNAPAIALYRSLGFVKVDGQNTQTTTWHIPKE